VRGKWREPERKPPPTGPQEGRPRGKNKDGFWGNKKPGGKQANWGEIFFEGTAILRERPFFETGERICFVHSFYILLIFCFVVLFFVFCFILLFCLIPFVFPLIILNVKVSLFVVLLPSFPVFCLFCFLCLRHSIYLLFVFFFVYFVLVVYLFVLSFFCFCVLVCIIPVLFFAVFV